MSTLYFAEALSLGQTVHEPAAGVKVWSVQSGSAAEKAGIKAGDYISDWNQGSHSGTISSPFDYYGIEREYAPRGAVTLKGTANGNAASWTLNKGSWGMKVWATWPEAQPVLEHLNQFSDEKKFSAMAEYCKVACANLDAKTGQRSYAYYFAATHLADGLRKTREMEQAADFFSKALAAAQNDKNALEIYSSWEKSYENISDWAHSIQISQKALVQAEQLAPQSLTTAWIYYDLARQEVGAGKLKEADEAMKRVLSMARAIAPKGFLVGKALNGIGAIAEFRGDLNGAVEWYQNALQIAPAIDNPEFTCIIYMNLGENAYQRRNLPTAEKYLTQGLDVATRSGVPNDIKSRLLLNLGDVADQRYNVRRAENFFNRALSLNETDEELLAQILGNLAGIKAYEGNATEALKLYPRVLEIDRRVAPLNLALDMVNYGWILKVHGDLKKAEEVTSRGLSIAVAARPEASSTAEYRVFLAEIYAAEGKLKQAERELLKALPVLEKLEQSSIKYADCLSSLAGVEQRLGQTSAALAHHQRALAVLDSASVYLGGTDSVRFGSKYAEIGGNFVDLLVKRGDVRRAFETLDHSRARTLVRGLSERSLDIRAGVPDQLLAQDRELEKELEDLSEQRVNALTTKQGKGIAELERKISSTTADHELAEERIRGANPRYAALTERSLPSLLQIQRSLEPNTAVLEYRAGKERSYLFVVDRNRVASFPLAGSTELDKMAGSTYELWSRQNRTPQTESAPLRLSKCLLGSSWDLIKQHERLIVITEGKLQYIPFVALPIPTSSVALQQPIGTRFEVVCLPSASLLVALRQHPTPRNRVTDSIAVIGDPVFTNDDARLSGQVAMSSKPVMVSLKRDAADSESDELAMSLDEEDIRGKKLGRLIHSREEAEAIASSTSPEKLFMALDFDANLTIALDPRITNSRIVHFATHGFYDPKNPTMSGLVFSLVTKDGRQQPGFLGLDQVYRSHYSADLVVLSACETGLGEEASGEGLVGLTWGFIYAGARSVVSSLWQVNDASTAELMRIFYSGMEKKGMTPAAALREAQMAIAQRPQWSAPYYWAGFVLEGEYAK